MSKYETTHHGINNNSTTVHYADGKVMVETIKPLPPEYPFKGTETIRVNAVHEVEQFVELVDEVLGYVATDEDTPAQTRARSVRLNLGDLAEAVRQAFVTDEDLTDADTRLDWCLRYIGIDETEYREAAGR